MIIPVASCPQPHNICFLLFPPFGLTDSSSLQKLQQAWGEEGSTVQLDLQDSSSAGSLLQAASDVVAANPDASVTVLDHSALKVGTAGLADLGLHRHHAVDLMLSVVASMHAHLASSHRAMDWMLSVVACMLHISHPVAPLCTC